MTDTYEMNVRDDLVWETAVSMKGVEFKIGSAGDANAANEPAREKAKKPFDIKGRREPTGEPEWRRTPDDIKNKAAISQYLLVDHMNDFLIYRYTLVFESSEHYNYYLYDESGDHYQVNTFLNGKHSVSFNSRKPTIVRVTGS
ncbi:hypothetical protein EUX98_g7639 [Antrodiella citrinella]|uniref:Uncharacterized protein n=1 Tax=Antrodiella citrinella TaxID=2447956 RepID=A0A4S4MT81_9APHY|nr:hypothetical protein EUX98_g7639 [Antrodiella citrinella]